MTNLTPSEESCTTYGNADGSDPKDNDPYSQYKRNYFLSTHKRFGTDDSKIPVSTTREMQQQILSANKSQIRHSIAPRGYPYLVRESCRSLMKDGTGVYPVSYVVTDYTTTNQYDYRHPNPKQDKPVQVDLSPPPPIYRRVGFTPTEQDNTKSTKKIRTVHTKPPPYVNLALYYGESNENEQITPCNCPTSEKQNNNFKENINETNDNDNNIDDNETQ